MAKVNRAKKGTFWRVPSAWSEKGRLHPISADDKGLVKINRQRAAQQSVAAQRKAKRDDGQAKQGNFQFPAQGDKDGKP